MSDADKQFEEFWSEYKSRPYNQNVHFQDWGRAIWDAGRASAEHRIAELKAEVAELEAKLGDKPLPPVDPELDEIVDRLVEGAYAVKEQGHEL